MHKIKGKHFTNVIESHAHIVGTEKHPTDQSNKKSNEDARYLSNFTIEIQ